MSTELVEVHQNNRMMTTLSIQDTINSLDNIRGLVAKTMVDGTDYGVIPGTNDKKVLLLPGAQKTAMYFNTCPSYKIERCELGNGHVEFIITAKLISRFTGEQVSEGVGSCSTMEAKYRLRRAARLCPSCGQAAIIKGKAEFGGGHVCLAPETPILYSDFSWRPIGEAKEGDAIVGFDENPLKWKGSRKFRPTIIEKVWPSRQRTKRLITDTAEFITTAAHRWLQHHKNSGHRGHWDGRGWASTDELFTGNCLRQIGVHEQQPATDDYRAGYLAGMTLGDGTMRFTPGQSSTVPSKAYWRVALSASDEAAIGRLVAYLAHFGIGGRTGPFGREGETMVMGRPVMAKPMKRVALYSIGGLGKLHALMQPKDSRDYKRGFLAGFFDAEGTGQPKKLRVYQNDIAVLETVRDYAASIGYVFTVHVRPGECSSATLNGGILERIRFLADCQPALLRKAGTFGAGMCYNPTDILAVEDGPMMDVVDIQTSTGTFFANGVATHNCWKKKGGCGASFKDGDKSIEEQPEGTVENENIHDSRNTVLKMAKKRAIVDAAIALGCMSELFTQDIENEESAEGVSSEQATETLGTASYEKYCAKIPEAPSLEMLNQAQTVYKVRKDFTDKQKEHLNTLTLKRREELLEVKKDADQLTAMMDKTPKPVTDLYDELDATEWSPQLAKLSEWENSLNASAAVHGFRADDYRVDLQTRWAMNAYMKCPASKDWKSIGEQIGKAVKDEAALARLEDARLEAANRLKIKL